MARPVDESLRENLLDDVLLAISRMGLGELSLRSLAREIGVSAHMLLYHFGSREAILDAVVAETSRRLATASIDLSANLPDIVRASWAWMTDPDQRGFLNVFYEVCAVGARDPARRGAIASALFTDWHRLLVHRGMRDTDATLLSATLHGLLLDLVLTGDRERVQRAFHAYAAALTSKTGAFA